MFTFTGLLGLINILLAVVFFSSTKTRPFPKGVRFRWRIAQVMVTIAIVLVVLIITGWFRGEVL